MGKLKLNQRLFCFFSSYYSKKDYTMKTLLLSTKFRKIWNVEENSSITLKFLHFGYIIAEYILFSGKPYE